MSKHAPGPWTSIGADEYAQAIWDAEANDVCRFEVPPRMEDVRVLRTAPELLEALSGLLTELVTYPLCPSSRGVERTRLQMAAETAIAKARGES